MIIHIGIVHLHLRVCQLMEIKRYKIHIRSDLYRILHIYTLQDLVTGAATDLQLLLLDMLPDIRTCPMVHKVPIFIKYLVYKVPLELVLVNSLMDRNCS